METLKELRQSKGLTQAELGKLARVDQAAILSYENGRYKPGMITTYWLAKALGVKMEDIVRSIEGGAPS